MTPGSSEREFRKFATDQGLDVCQLSATEAVRLAIEFYSTRRVRWALIEDDEDMLLFQWGTHVVAGKQIFSFDLTRQFIWASPFERFVRAQILRWEPADVTKMSQLHLTLVFESRAELAELGEGNRWCPSPADLAEFRNFVFSSEAYRQVVDLALSPSRVELVFEYV